MDDSHYISFVCTNEPLKRSLQVVLDNCIREGENVIVTVPKKYTAEIPTPNGTISTKLTKEIFVTERNGIISTNQLDDLVRGSFSRKRMIAQVEGYLYDLLDYHLSEYHGNQIDYLKYLEGSLQSSEKAAKIWVEKKVSEINDKPEKKMPEVNDKAGPEKNLESNLDAIEKLIILELLQQSALFLLPNNETSNQSFFELISKLTGIGLHSVKAKMNRDVKDFFSSNEQLTNRQIDPRLKNITKIEPIINKLDIPKLTKIFDDLKDKTEIKINKARSKA